MVPKILIIGHESSVGAGTIPEYLEIQKLSYGYIIASEIDKYANLQETEYFIILGGTLNVGDENKIPWLKTEKRFIKDLIQSSKKGLGICLGGQLLAEALGAKVTKNKYEEVGWFPLQISDDGKRKIPLKEIGSRDKVMQSHEYTFGLPANSVLLASSEATKNQAFLYDERILGVQFHPEVSAESVRKFYESHDDEGSGPFIQKSSEILRHSEYFERSKEIMFSLLDWLFDEEQTM